jgi:glutamate/tyrosine decarboxylase-like PLP-dependent enzyme
VSEGRQVDRELDGLQRLLAMTAEERRAILEEAESLASEFLRGLPERHVAATATAEAMRAHFGAPLAETGEDPRHVLTALASQAHVGHTANAGPRFFGFVIGGTLPVAIAADWLTAAWDQNPGLFILSPIVAVVEEVTGGWICDLLGLPAESSVGFVTGCQMAHVTALAAARHGVLRRAGWDVERKGLHGAPPLRVVVGGEAHVTVPRALRLLGLGTDAAVVADADSQGRMRPDALEAILRRGDGPTIVCAQVGNIDTGACDPLEPIAALCKTHTAWLHVDGAFGLWAAATPRYRHLVAGANSADSWATDAHKWLNVPQDSGIAIVRDSAAHRAAMTSDAAYLQKSPGDVRDAVDWVPEFSRRARSIPVYAALRSLGRRGVSRLVENCCERASHMVRLLSQETGVEVLNDVVLNQALLRFHADGVDADALTRSVISRVQEEGTCWLGGTTWHGMSAMRLSFVNWRTTEADVERSAASILQCYRAERAARGSSPAG